MKILLVAINAKYIHSNLAVYSLYANAGEAKNNIEIAEYTINHYLDDILADIYKKTPDVIAISCYVWNINLIKMLVPELKKVLPKAHIWLGGPEVSYYPEKVINELPAVTGVMLGEGERTFAELSALYLLDNNNETVSSKFSSIGGICLRNERGIIVYTAQRQEAEFKDYKFMYSDLSDFENRIIYYESSRGCPFHCAYCLSAADNKLRFKDLSTVFDELKFFMDNKVKQVKFVDRTFNSNKEHAMAIWQFILDNDNQITNFHFEVEADILNDEELNLLEKMRPGLVQLEAGVQSTNIETLKAINRRADFAKIAENVKKIKSFNNIHMHLDLIAGLPYEGLESLKKSFDDVYGIGPDNLQLGFLKLLKGTPIYEKAEEYGIVYKQNANYEVLKTNWMGYDELLKLKDVEKVLEIFYNSGQFKNCLKVLQNYYDSPFEMYMDLSDFYEQKGHFLKHSRIQNYEIMRDFVAERKIGSSVVFDELLTLDLYLRENMKKRPDFAGKMILQKGKNIHTEVFGRDIVKYVEEGIDDAMPTAYTFDYDNRDRLTNEAKLTKTSI